MPGAATQAFVTWRNKDTGEVYQAPNSGYIPKEGTSWERERRPGTPSVSPSTEDKARQALIKVSKFKKKASREESSRGAVNRRSFMR